MSVLPAERMPRWRRVGRILAFIPVGLVVAGGTVWAAGALYYSNFPLAAGRAALAALFAVAAPLLFLRLRPWTVPMAIWLAGLGGVMLWQKLIPASHDRHWQPDVARLPVIEREGERVTIRNVRNFDFRTDADFTVQYDDRTYDLSQLRTLDALMSYWGPRAICHTFLSFGFADGRYIAVSVETRKEVGEQYSAIKGAFRQYELIYVWADERDVIRVRTNVRGEDVYIYRIPARPEQIRQLFLDYVARTNALARQPEFYNAFTNSCGLNIIYHIWSIGDQPSGWELFWSGAWWRLLLNGYWDTYAGRRRGLDDAAIAARRAQARVTDLAKAADRDPDFSQRIRANLTARPPDGRTILDPIPPQ